MAYSIYRSAGTSELSFQIGLTGLTIYQGTGDPNSSPPINPSGGPFVDGDLYFRNNPGSMSIYARDTGSWAVISGGAAVTSFGPVGFPRTGDVNPAAGDYDADQVDFDPSGVTLTSGNVQDAMEELDARWVALGGPFLELAGGTMGAAADITMGAAGQHLADGAASYDYPAYAFGTDDQSGMYSPAVGELGFGTNSAARLKLDNAGRIIAETANYETLVDSDQVLTNKKYVDEKPIPYDLALYIGGPMPAADDVVGGMVVTRNIRIPAGLTGSQAYALDASHGSLAEYFVEVDGSPIGSVRFNASTNAGTFFGAWLTVDTDLTPGQRITVVTPNPIVSGIEDVMITIVACAATTNCNPGP